MYAGSQEVERDNEYSGLTGFHNAGYIGQGQVIWNMETGDTSHGETTSLRIRQSAPGAKVVHGSVYATYNSDTIKYEKVIDDEGNECSIEDFIQKHGITICSRSIAGGFAKRDSAWGKFWLDLQKKYNLILVNSIGNEGDVQKGEKDRDIAILVGSCVLINGVLTRPYYSTTGLDLDFTDFYTVALGTSFSCPYFAGRTAVLRSRYGAQLTQEQVVSYFEVHCQDDAKQDGWDSHFGYGLPIMGDPKEEFFQNIDPAKHEVKFTIGSCIAKVDGKDMLMDTPPIYDNKGDRMLIPVRYVADAFGLGLDWEESIKTVTLTWEV